MQARPTVAAHFEKKPPEVRALYDGVLAATRKWGVVLEAPNTGSSCPGPATLTAQLRDSPACGAACTSSEQSLQVLTLRDLRT